MDEELIEELLEDAERLLSAAADPSKAPEMAAYMKTDMHTRSIGLASTRR